MKSDQADLRACDFHFYSVFEFQTAIVRKMDRCTFVIDYLESLVPSIFQSVSLHTQFWNFKTTLYYACRGKFF